MKTLLATIAIGITTAATSIAGPSWGVTLGNGAGFSWNNGGPRCMPRPIYVQEQRPQVYVTGPQYYRVHGFNPNCNRRIRNHMDAPLVVDYHNRGGRRESVVIPASWD